MVTLDSTAATATASGQRGVDTSEREREREMQLRSCRQARAGAAGRCLAAAPRIGALRSACSRANAPRQLIAWLPPAADSPSSSRLFAASSSASSSSSQQQSGQVDGEAIVEDVFYDVETLRAIRVSFEAEQVVEYRVQWKDGSPDTWCASFFYRCARV